jgi:hypothetical protein
MLLHTDGSLHPWFSTETRAKQTLIAIMDDATNHVYAAQFIPEEATLPMMALIREVVEKKGVFCSLYTDRASHFHTTRHGGTHVKVSPHQGPTQVERALLALGIQLILAGSPQARGRMERLFGTWQGRLPQELRIKRITTFEAANRHLTRVFIPWHNRNFAVKPLQEGTAFTPCHREDLDRIFSIHHHRTVDNDNTVRVANIRFQIDESPLRVSFAKCRVTVYQHLDDSFSIGYGPHTLGRFKTKGTPILKQPKTITTKAA